ncbi:uncharacterized protein LOC124279129 isoform X2 [Haliotis rubra]|uniref:uncharacterized protein LOC124279129 isoform X2 n=1 Tax=Haliotis rubra TaxID=36100 RepID=UPI001EE52DF7|nr:uncharacterized protein LOC124279129 isoform X2 [Haliotis rubra]
MPHTMQQQQMCTQASTLHPGPSAASTQGRQEAGYPQAARPPHDIMPTHAMGQYGHWGSPGYGMQSPSPEVPSLSKPLPHQTGCPETSSTPSSDNIGELKSCFMKRPIEDSWLKVSHVLQSACVKVTSLTQDTTDDSIKFYFMNRRKSDGGDVRTVTRSPDGTGAIVHFYDPEVARRVCARTHKLHKTDVVVTFHHELLEPWGSKDEPSHGTSPANTGAQQGPRSSRSSGTSGRGNHRSVIEEPAATSRSTTKVAGKAQPGRQADPPEGMSRSVIIKTLDVYVVDFLWKSAPGQKEFVKYMKETLHSSVRFIPQPENRVMLLVEHSGPVHSCSAWKATIEKEVSEYVSTYLKVECLRTSVPECLLGDILKAVNPILKSNPSLVRLNHGKKNTDLIICGFRGKWMM